MMRPLSLLLALAALAAPLAAAPLPAGVDPAELSGFLGEDLDTARLEALWSDPGFHFRVAAALAKNARPAKASWHLGEAVRLDPEDGRAHLALGKLLWRFGEQARAKDHWVRALECARPEPKAQALLAKLAPALAGEPARIDELDVFFEVARVSADLRRVGEVQQALTAYAQGAGAPLVLTPSNWREQLETLASFGLLTRRGGLPSGEGTLLTDAAGNAISSEYGSARAPRNLPSAMSHGRGYRVSPEVLEKALASGRPEAVELALTLFEPAHLERCWPTIAALEGLRTWPSALDQVCFRLETRPALGALPGEVLRMLRGLTDDVEGVEAGHRWTARAHLWRQGVRELPPLPEAELLPLLGAAYQRPSLMDAAHSALQALGPRAEAPLLELLARREGSTALGAALALLPVYATPKAVIPLVELVEVGRARGYPPTSELKPLEALKALTGADFGRDMAAWRTWASEHGVAD